MKKALAGLALLATLAGAVVYGFAAHKWKLFPYRQLRAAYLKTRPVQQAHRVARSPGDASRKAQRDRIGALTQLPYLQGYNPATNQRGVIVNDSARAFRGWNLAVSAHGAGAQLLDMSGAVHHRWALGIQSAWPDRKAGADPTGYDQYWRRAELLPGGDLLVVWEYIGLARIDRQSRLLWASANGAHHDLAVSGDGTIYVLTHEMKILPDINPDDPVSEDFVTILKPDGQLVRKISLLTAFDRSDYAAALAPMQSEGDVLHANSIQILDGSLAGRSPAFAAGNLLVSLRSLNIVAVLDPRAERIVWSLSGLWRGQHAPRILGNGRMLVFDNFGLARADSSRVLEIDPFSQEIAWRYGEGEGQAIFSESNGSAERLGNGNTLIVESNAGRAFEVTPGGEIVWEYLNPFRTGEKKDLVATLKQLSRLDPGLPVDWAERPDGGP